MTDDLLVHHVELSLLRNEPFYIMMVQDGELLGTPEHPAPEGAIACRAVLAPATVFESRAAEYGIDPDSPGGWDDLLHLVIAPKGEEDRDVAAELADPDHLFNAPTIEHARKAKMARIRKAMGTRKLRGVPGVSEHRLLAQDATRIAESDAEDPLEFIKRTAPMSPEHIAVKQEFVRRHRHKVKARRLGLDPDRAYSEKELEQHAKRRAAKAAKKVDQQPQRETPDQLATRLLGAPLDDVQADRLPPRSGTPSKDL